MASLAEGCPLSIQQGTNWACAAVGPQSPHLGRLDLEVLMLFQAPWNEVPSSLLCTSVSSFAKWAPTLHTGNRRRLLSISTPAYLHPLTS